MARSILGVLETGPRVQIILVFAKSFFDVVMCVLLWDYRLRPPIGRTGITEVITNDELTADD